MDNNLYEILMEKLGQLKSAVDDYLNNTPPQSIQGDRGALKGAFNELEEVLQSIPEPTGADAGEITDDTFDANADVEDDDATQEDAPSDEEMLDNLNGEDDEKETSNEDLVNQNEENPDGDDVTSDDDENIENADSSGDEQESNDSESEDEEPKEE